MAGLQPSMTRSFYAIFEVPPDAKGMKFVARGLGVMHDKAPVGLGL
jgi:aromatic ring hydroxylase